MGAFELLRQHLAARLPADPWQQVDTSALPVRHPSRVRGPDGWLGPAGLHAGFGRAAGAGRPARPGCPGSVRARGLVVVVFLAGEFLLRRYVGIGEHLEGMAGRRHPDRTIGLLDRTAFPGGGLLHGQLGQRVGLQPLVGDRPAAAHRPAVAAGGKPRLGPLHRRPPRTRELVDGRAGLPGVTPVGVVDVAAQVGRVQPLRPSRQQPLEPGSLSGEQRPC